MLTQFKNQVKIEWKDWFSYYSFCLLFACIGSCLLFLLFYILKEDADVTVPVGGLFACIIGVIFLAAVQGLQTVTLFRLQISMGSTRKGFFLSHYTVSLLGGVILLALLLIYDKIESIVYAAAFPHVAHAFSMTPYLLRYGLPAVISILVLAGLAGALYMRFGKRAGWIFWTLWMALCIGGPQIPAAVEENPDSPLGRLGLSIIDFVKMFPYGVWMTILAAICIVCLVITYRIFYKQQV